MKGRLPATARIDISILVICAGAIALAFFLTPGDEVVSLFGWEIPPLCTFRRVFGENCPGCGLTRSWVYLVNGEFEPAWRMNKLGLAMFVLAASQIPWRLWLLARTFGFR